MVLGTCPLKVWQPFASDVMWCGGANLIVPCLVNVSRSVVNNLKPVLEHPVCTCGTHMVWSRVRLSMLNDPQRNTILLKALSQVGPGPTLSMSSDTCL